MRTSLLCCLFLLLALSFTTAQAAGPIATPYGSDLIAGKQISTYAPNKSFGDPTDFRAAALAARQYLRLMQADSDLFEDNALNGNPDIDPQDSGWDWSSTVFQHSAGVSSGNLYGVIANNLFKAYQMDPDPFILNALTDVAEHTLAVGPDPAYPIGLHYPSDILFLLNYAELPEAADPAALRAMAEDIWDWRVTNTGNGTAAGIATAISASRASQGYANGIIPWDISPYVAAAMALGYEAEAKAIAEVLYQDSFVVLTDRFDFEGRCKGSDLNWDVNDYYWYALGIQGLIEAFTQADVHTDQITLLTERLAECQYPSGAYSYQYGANPEIDDTDWQATGYCMMTVHDYLPITSANPENLDALYRAGSWLASTQDASGGFVYSSGNHYPEVGSEGLLGLVCAWDAAGATVSTTFDGADPALCSVTKTATIAYDCNDGTPGLFGYQMLVEITGPVTVDKDDFSPIYSMDFFQVLDLGAGVFSVNGTLYGAQAGILTDVDLFDVDMVTNGDGDVALEILSYNLRDPQNMPFYAEMIGAGFVSDCTAPDPVTDIVAMPGHNKVEVDWNHSGADVDHYVMFAGVWHDGANASAYPEYDDLVGNKIPTRPADYAAADLSAEWDEMTTTVTVTEQVQTWDNANDRGVYYYEVFAVDAAGNISAPAAANDRATNYWLGDVDADGEVAVIDDINQLGAAFGTSDPHDDYNAYCDVGPTDNWSRLGIPTTDSTIDFEDLMIFSMNFSVVTGDKSQAPISRLVTLAWVDLEDGRMALRLVDGTGVKGLRVRAPIEVTSVVPGSLLGDQTERTFFMNVGRNLDANLAVMGANKGFVGTGDLLIISTDRLKAASALEITIRGTDNSKLEYTINNASGAASPKVFALNANYPNPFNPSTKISFSLPETQHVQLSVYDLNGRCVRTLISDLRDPGLYEVVWNGRDDGNQPVSSGTYFFRVEAGPYSQARKMTLLK